MDLKSYIESLPKPARADKKREIAEATGRSESTVKSWVNGNRGIPPECWIEIEAITNNHVTCSDLLKERSRGKHAA